MKIARRWLIVLLGFATGCPQADDAGAPGDPPPFTMAEVRIVPLVEAEQLYAVRSVTLDADLQVAWLVTANEPHVHRVDLARARITSFGTDGGGPNELRYPIFARFDAPAHAVDVLDAGGRAIVRFSEDGAFLSRTPTPPLGLELVRGDIEAVSYGRPFRVRSRGDSLVWAQYPAGLNHTSEFPFGRIARLVPNAAQPEVLLDFGTDLSPAPKGILNDPFRAIPLWDLCPSGELAVLDPVGLVVTWRWPGLPVHDSLRIPAEPRPTREADVRRYLMHVLALELRGEVGGAPAMAELEKAVAGLMQNDAAEHFGAVLPAFTDLLCASDGTVWLRDFDTTADPRGFGRIWRAYRPAGPFGRYVLPPSFFPTHIDDGQMFGLVVDSLGLEVPATLVFGGLVP